MNPELINRIRQLVSEGRFEEALGFFDENWADTNILALKSRLQLLQQKKVRGVISIADETVETNSIVDSLLQWTDKYSEVLIDSNNNSDTVTVDAQLILLIKNKLANSLTFYYTLTFVPIIAGIGLGGFFFFDNGINTTEGIGSALITSISGLPLREIINRKDRISFLDILLVRIGNIKDKYEIQKINTLSWTIIETTILKTQLNG